MYDDIPYARTRLLGTVVMHKRTPVVIHDIDYNGVATVRAGIGREVIMRVPISDLNMTDFKLGFLNKNDDALFMARRTLRHDWRQGLRERNVAMGIGRDAPSMNDIMKTLLQRYPSAEEAMNFVGNKYGSKQAWCSEFALDSGGGVHWRYRKCGQTDGDKITLDNKFKFLSTKLSKVYHGHIESI